MAIDMREKYAAYFGADKVSIYSAPGRSELGGNHTDHQNGQVLAAAVDLMVTAAAAPLREPSIEIYSEGYGHIKLDISDLSARGDEVGTAAGLIRGVLAGLAQKGFSIGGFRAYISGDVPAGSGLSSSAALEILIGRIQSDMYNNDSVSPVELALAGKFAENEYFGKPCGLMDQLTCAMGGIVYMDFAYDECPIIEQIHFDFDDHGYSMCITDTGSSHADLTDEYAAVPAEMKQVAGIFGRETLRGISVEQLLGRASEIRQKVGDRAFLRALHFAKETVRARQEADALKDGDLDAFLALVKESGDSSYKLLQNIYPAENKDGDAAYGSYGSQSLAVALAVSEEVLGEDGVCRVHGGGFAGTIQAFVRKEAVSRYKGAMDKLFGDGACRVLELLGGGDR